MSWHQTGEWVNINTGGDLESIWVPRNTIVWAGYNGGEWKHAGCGNPSAWVRMDKPKPKAKVKPKAKAKLRRTQQKVIHKKPARLGKAKLNHTQQKVIHTKPARLAKAKPKNTFLAKAKPKHTSSLLS